MSCSKQNSTKKAKLWKPSFEYKVDYNDHFETPITAYHDILPILDFLKSKRNDHILYDPYYCNGRTAILLRQLGFNKVVHAKRDFYKDIEENNIPPHDTLVTNPPYSESHKEKCIAFVIKQLKKDKRPFFLLMPNYVAAKHYYRRLLIENDCAQDVAYLAPSTPYDYDHPEGTGHDIPPFNSLWFVGVGKENIQGIKKSWKSHPGSPKFLTSLEDLEEQSIITTQRRPNPRQRKKRREKKSSNKQDKQKMDQTKSIVTTSSKKSKKMSRYRDGDGKRIRKRF